MLNRYASPFANPFSPRLVQRFLERGQDCVVNRPSAALVSAGPIENPHTRIVIEVADARGQKETWAIETVPGVSPVWWRLHIAKSVRSNG